VVEIIQVAKNCIRKDRKNRHSISPPILYCNNWGYHHQSHVNNPAVQYDTNKTAYLIVGTL
jgi:hypothetical protein